MTHGLNAAQSEAVRYLDGPCLVLAGAGSGKTRVITQKIAHLIEDKGFEPRHIAAVTFTNKAAKEMQERIGKLMEGKTTREGKRIPLKQLTVCTFHSLGVQILRMEAEHVGLKPQFSIMDSDDCFGLVQEQLATTDKKLIRSVQGTISLWKNGMVDPETALAQAANADEHQAAMVYRNYVATLHAYQAVDFDDLIRLPAELFARDETVRLKWQNRLRYFLVDEYQDTNACQYALLKLLAGGSHLRAPAFTAVGDDDQAIYGWRGATLDNLRGLQTDFPDLKVIKLEQNYRSTVRILEAANAVIANNPKLFDKKLWSEHGMGDPIAIHPMNDEEHEAESVVFRLSAHKFERRAQFRDYAILYRGNHQARLFEQILRRERIPYVLSGGQSFFDKAEIKDICAYLRLIANPDDDPAFIRAITTPKRGVGNTTLEALGTFAGQAKVSLFEAAMMGGIEGKLQPRQLEPLRVFCESMVRLADRAKTDPATVLLDDMMAGIHYESYLYDHLRRTPGPVALDQYARIPRLAQAQGHPPGARSRGGRGHRLRQRRRLWRRRQEPARTDPDRGADEHARRPRGRPGRGAALHAPRLEGPRISARVPGGRGGGHPAPRARGRRHERREDRGRAPADVRRHHARPAQPPRSAGARSASAPGRPTPANPRASSPK